MVLISLLHILGGHLRNLGHVSPMILDVGLLKLILLALVIIISVLFVVEHDLYVGVILVLFIVNLSGDQCQLLGSVV